MIEYEQKIKYLELLTRGLAHHHRIRTLLRLDSITDQTLEEIAEYLNTDYKNASQHVQKMHRAGLVSKKYQGHTIIHSLTNKGREFLLFYNSIEL
ncbi:MAG: helix-turn-helix domain-containing protein [Candidatus Campbellbacteria bacterium]|nr:helix-turn-helix domain-containing protein [Candidatus Campbellbacteria bacterium]